jgi:hypothetical protein
MERVDVQKSKSGTAGGPLKPGFGLSGVALLPCRVFPPGAPSFRAFCARVDAADIPHFTGSATRVSAHAVP